MESLNYYLYLLFKYTDNMVKICDFHLSIRNDYKFLKYKLWNAIEKCLNFKEFEDII